MDPMTAMLMSSIGQQAIGGKQLGGIAPPPMLGGGQSVDAISRLARENNFGQGGMIGGLPPSPPQETPEPSGFGKFFGNLDKTLSSPSKTLLIGGLGQVDPKLALAGLLASGFMRQQ